MSHLAIFLGDDSGYSAACPLLELRHFQSNGDQGHQHDLGVLVDLGNILLVAINKEPGGSPCTPSTTESEDDTKTICKNKA